MRPVVMGGGVKEERMGPDGTGVDGDAPDDVCTVTATEPGVAAPIVKPQIVTVNAVVFSMAVPDIVSTTAVLLVTPHVTFIPVKLLAPVATTGATNGAKKFGG